MKEKVRLRVRMELYDELQEFVVPLHLSVEEAMERMNELCGNRRTRMRSARNAAALMFLEGKAAGCVVAGDVTVGELVRAGLVTDGSALALV